MLSFLRGHDSGKRAAGALGPESHSHPFSKHCLGTYCVPACPQRGCSPPSLWMRGFLNFISECYSSCLTTDSVPKKWVVVPEKEARGAKPGPERVGGWSKVTQQA